MSKRVTQMHWTAEQASHEFGGDGETISKALKRSMQEPAFKDGTFATLQIVKALYGDYDGARTRKMTADAIAAERENAEKAQELIPARVVSRLWEMVIADLRQKVMFSALPEESKRDILRDLQNAPINEYFGTLAAEAEGVPESEPEPVEPAAGS